MQPEANKATVRRWFEDLFNAGNLDVADEIVTPDHAHHDPTLPDIPSGPEGQRQIVGLYRDAFWSNYDAMGIMQQIGAVPQQG